VRGSRARARARVTPRADSRGPRRWWPAVCLIASGCCSAPLAERYFDRQEAFDSLQGFAYAVDAGQYRFAYESLTPESQKQISFSRFKLALRWNVNVPEVKVPIRDLVLKSERQRFRKIEDDSRHVRYEVQLDLPGEVSRAVHIFLEKETEAAAKEAGHEEPLWLIDLSMTGQMLQASQSQTDAADAR
jgi:hypothetical protein